MRSLTDRLHAQLIIDPSGCLLWDGARLPKGYGRISLGDRKYLTHRVAYELYVGPIPDGWEVDHLCRVTSCAAPDHLEAVTPEENRRRQAEQQTACRRAGHPLRPLGTRTGRACLQCRREKRALDRLRAEQATSPMPFTLTSA